MPELIEVEIYRRQAEIVVGRTIGAVPVIDPIGLRGVDPAVIEASLTGATVTGTGRRGKLLLLETDGPTLGLRFGMTGRLIVDGGAGIDELIYGGRADKPEWDRYVISFDDGSDLRLRDPRRLGGLALDPDLDSLGPEASTVTPEQLDQALGRSTAAVKSRLLDQARLAGLGNLLVDEILWRSGIDPARPAVEIDASERASLAAAIVETVADLTERGGSHTGDLQEFRDRGTTCPADGAPLLRRQVGGRTTYSCPDHQI